MLIVLGTQRLALSPARDAVVEHALRRGVSWLDTADVYGAEPGDAERWLAAYGGRVCVATKGGLVREGTRWRPNGAAAALMEAAERSRERLGVTSIDLWQWHAEDPRVDVKRSLRGIRNILESGVARRVGLSNPRVSTLKAACDLFPVSLVQVELSPLQPRSVWRGVIDEARERGIPVWGYRPFSGEKGARRLLQHAKLGAAAARYDVSPAGVVLAWLRTLGVIPLPGPSSVSHLEECLTPCSDAVDWEWLDQTFSDVARLRVPRAGRVVARGDGEVVLLMGTPGAGKSTRVALYPDHLRLNRDERGGTLSDVARALDHALAAGQRRIVLDNTYPSRVARGEVLSVTERHGVPVRCEWLDTSADDAEVNVVARLLDHFGRLPEPEDFARGGRKDPTLVPPRALSRWREEFEPPELGEGFARVDVVPFVRRAAGGSNRLLFLDPADLDGLTPSGAAEYERAGFKLVVLGWGTGEARDRALALARPLGATTYWCDHPAGPPVCWCRKPLPGLGVLALRKLDGDPFRSRFAGNRPADRTLARKLGVPLLDSLM